jgi:hypothetical protein
MMWWIIIYAAPAVAVCVTVSVAQAVEVARFRPLSVLAAEHIAIVVNGTLGIAITAVAGVISSPDARFSRRLASGAVYSIYSFLAYVLLCVTFVFNR